MSFPPELNKLLLEPETFTDSEKYVIFRNVFNTSITAKYDWHFEVVAEYNITVIYRAQGIVRVLRCIEPDEPVMYEIVITRSSNILVSKNGRNLYDIPRDLTTDGEM